ncbi:hypothetical protein [Bacillus alkalicellulosilyticus]|uniref:hypothetical protein n=1 Tax=Alkalihalobacterium alkalicellulosilyticum TaxID=1912214 RepID=UPI00099843DE|nr:hypothetical protein [Bacillus alkalicellulosilyticus]
MHNTVDWIKKKFNSNQKLWFYLLGLIGTLATINIAFFYSTHFWLSMSFTVIIIFITSYYLSLFFMFIKKKQRNYIHKNHEELLEKLNGVLKEVADIEERVTNDSKLQYDAITTSLQALDEKIYHNMVQSTTDMTEKMDTMHDQLVTLQLEHKEQLTSEAQHHGDTVEQLLRQQYKALEKQGQTAQEQIQKNIASSSQGLLERVEATKEAVLETVTVESNQVVKQLDEVKKQVDTSVKEMKDEHSKWSEESVLRSNELHSKLVDTVKSESNQVEMIVTETKNQIDQRLEELSSQHALLTEEVVRVLKESEDVVLSKLVTENTQVGTIIIDVKTKLEQHVNELTIQNDKSTQELVRIAKEHEETVLTLLKSENDATRNVVVDAREQLENKVIGLNVQLLQNTHQLQEQVSETEAKIVAALIEETEQLETAVGQSVQTIEMSLGEIKELNVTLTDQIKEETKRLEGMLLESIQLENNQVGALVENTRIQLARELLELRDETGKNTETVLAQSTQDATALLDAIAETENELTTRVAECLSESTNRLEVVSSFLHEMIEYASESIVSNGKAMEQELVTHINGAENATKEHIETLAHSVDENMEQLSMQIDNVERSHQGEFTKAFELIEHSRKTIVNDLNDTTYQVTLDINNKLESVAERESTKVTSTISTKIEETGQAIKAIETRVSEQIESILEEQREWKKIFVEASIQEEEQYMGLSTQLHVIKDALTEIQNDALKKVANHFSEFTNTYQHELTLSKNMLEKKFQHVTEQFKMLTNNFSAVTDKFERASGKTNIQVNSLLDSGRIRGENLTNLLQKSTEFEQMLTNATIQMAEQQLEVNSKVDVLSSQMLTVNSILKLLQDNSGLENTKTVSIEEATNGTLRVEKIVDEENGLEIVNQYDKDVLTTSEMYEKGKLVYSANYDNSGNMKTSKNFDNAGNIQTEMSYFPNGAVKQRKERMKKNGKFIMDLTRFDQQGKKLK